MEKIQDPLMANALPSESTLAFYNENAETYARQTAQADLSELYARFLPRIPPGARILDVGCGGGRDLKRFKALGYDCMGIDSAPQLVRIAQEFSGCVVRVARAEDLAFVDEFDGVWACASLLHLTRVGLVKAAVRIHAALKADGVLFLSMQEGAGESLSLDGRFYARYSAEELEEILSSNGFSVLDQWSTLDTLPGRESLPWLNPLARRAAP